MANDTPKAFTSALDEAIRLREKKARQLAEAQEQLRQMEVELLTVAKDRDGWQSEYTKAAAELAKVTEERDELTKAISRHRLNQVDRLTADLAAANQRAERMEQAMSLLEFWDYNLPDETPPSVDEIQAWRDRANVFMEQVAEAEAALKDG